MMNPIIRQPTASTLVLRKDFVNSLIEKKLTTATGL